MRLALFAAAWMVLTALLAPDIAFRDAGEIGGAAWQLGIAHPTGFSLDMLWLHAWTWLPLGSAAFRMALGVAFVSAASLVLLFDVVARTPLDSSRQSAEGSPRSAAGPLVAVAALGTFATFLGTATLIEVYSTALLLSLAALREHLRDQPRIAVLAMLTGLAVGAHVTAWLACSSLLVATLISHRRAITRRQLVASATLGAIVVSALVAYLPLRSAVDPAFDWGDPETPSRVWEHLSAARIRTAFADTVTDSRPFFGQLAELAWCAPLLVVGVTRARTRVALPLALLTLDVAYGAWVNPMGIVDRQVGHLAGAMIAVLAGVGVDAVVAAHPQFRWFSVGALATSLGLGIVFSATHADIDPAGSDSMLGGGGVLATLPPRTVYVCSSDDACSAALFARYAAGERPDVVVLVAQHLWEPRERAKLPELSDDPTRPESGPARAELAHRVLQQVASSRRPLRFEDEASIPFRDRLRAAEPLVAQLGSSTDDSASSWSVFFESRFTASRRGCDVLARSYEALGRSHLRNDDLDRTRDAFARSVVASPERAVGWVNLAVVAARLGRLDEAIVMTELATRLEPSRATAWINLARYRGARDPRAGLATLDEARDHVPERELVRARDELNRVVN